MSYDLNQAEAQSETIPAGTEVPIRLSFIFGDAGDERTLHSSKSSSALMLSLEATVTGGKYAKRKFWPRYYMGAADGRMTEGQEQAVGISLRMIRAIVEAARGFAPTDETPAAIAARKLKSLDELDGMEVTVVTGIEKSEGYDDKVIIKRVVPHGKQKAVTAADEAAAHTAATKRAGTPVAGVAKKW